jgi:hypothetical protein
MSPINLLVRHLGIRYKVSLLQDDSFSTLFTRVESLTGVTTSHQTYVYKGKKLVHTSATTLKDTGLSDGAEMVMFGPKAQEFSAMVKAENEHKRREQIMRDRASRGTVKVRL